MIERSPVYLRFALMICVAWALVSCGEKAAPKVTDTSEPNSEAKTSENLAAVPGFESRDFVESLSPILEKVDPNEDAGWDSEVFSAAALEQLQGLGKSMKAGDFSALQDYFASSASASPLRPTSLQTISKPRIIIRRGQADDAPTIIQGEQGIRKALDDLVSLWRGHDEAVYVKFKLVRVVPTDSGTQASVLYHASGAGMEQNATWECQFTPDALPKIARIEVRDFEEIVPREGQRLQFKDETESLLGSQESYRDQLSLGIDHWRNRLQGDFGVDVNGLQGLALGDANGDGLDDLYVCQQGGLPNRLYVRQADGSLIDHSQASGTDWMELTRAALFIDLDNDGDQDLAMAQGWYLMLMENDGQGRFTKRLETPAQGQLHSLAAADYDNDGDLDIYFCGRNPRREQTQSEGILGMPIPYHDANNGGPNVLLDNQGGWKFSDVTLSRGLDVNNRRYSYACSWEDYDNDGDQDLYVANDFGRNNLYRNDVSIDGKFRDVSAQTGVEDISAGMGVTWGDPNRDGRMDAYVSNMFSAAGNRIAYQRHYRADLENEQLGQYQRHARGNTLFLNQGENFDDASEVAKVTMGRWAWGAKFADLNNDGWEDLYVANGFITTPDTGDL